MIPCHVDSLDDTVIGQMIFRQTVRANARLILREVAAQTDPLHFTVQSSLIADLHSLDVSLVVVVVREFARAHQISFIGQSRGRAWRDVSPLNLRRAQAQQNDRAKQLQD